MHAILESKIFLPLMIRVHIRQLGPKICLIQSSFPISTILNMQINNTAEAIKVMSIEILDPLSNMPWFGFTT
jgi:hypothetical protein